MAAAGAGVDLNVALTEILTRFGSVRIRDIGLRYAKLGRLGSGPPVSPTVSVQPATETAKTSRQERQFRFRATQAKHLHTKEHTLSQTRRQPLRKLKRQHGK
jgi:hypothetical protein